MPVDAVGVGHRGRGLAAGGPRPGDRVRRGQAVDVAGRRGGVQRPPEDAAAPLVVGAGEAHVHAARRGPRRRRPPRSRATPRPRGRRRPRSRRASGRGPHRARTLHPAPRRAVQRPSRRRGRPTVTRPGPAQYQEQRQRWRGTALTSGSWPRCQSWWSIGGRRQPVRAGQQLDRVQRRTPGSRPPRGCRARAGRRRRCGRPGRRRRRGRRAMRSTWGTRLSAKAVSRSTSSNRPSPLAVEGPGQVRHGDLGPLVERHLDSPTSPSPYVATSWASGIDAERVDQRGGRPARRRAPASPPSRRTGRPAGAPRSRQAWANSSSRSSTGPGCGWPNTDAHVAASAPASQSAVGGPSRATWSASASASVRAPDSPGRLRSSREPARAEVHRVPGHDLGRHRLVVAGRHLLGQQRRVVGRQVGGQPVERRRGRCARSWRRPPRSRTAARRRAKTSSAGRIVVDGGHVVSHGPARSASGGRCGRRRPRRPAWRRACPGRGRRGTRPARAPAASSPQLVAQARAAPNLRAWAGSTRLSSSPVSTSVAG